ncbi:5'-cyclic nucleotide phosphodiesterase 1C (Cam-PDE 1C) (3' [Durusdinium trenchii]
MPADFEPTMVLPGDSDQSATVPGVSPRRESREKEHVKGRASVSASLNSDTRAQEAKRKRSFGLCASLGGAVSSIRMKLASSRWYSSPLAVALRGMMQGRNWAILMVIALLLALFMPDIWVLAGVNDTIFIDVVLTLVMALFTLELLILSVVDSHYILSFFQLMDIFGTVSMIFDISFMLGVAADEAQIASNNADATANLMLLRAARAAKVGARAGRLSRVLRFLRFVPFLAGGDKQDENQTGIASMISGQLANLVATRVACLTIILVMVIPLFDIWTFPQSDYSLQTWVNRLSVDVDEMRYDDCMAELGLMKDFYDRKAYGPYLACIGVASTDSEGQVTFTCTQNMAGIAGQVAAFDFSREAPPRLSSSLIVHTGTFMVQVNMHSNAQVEAGFSMGTMTFIIVIMVFCGLALSSVVTDLAVRPLERMLGTVRKIASTVFKFTAEVSAEQNEEEVTDIDSSNEMKLLEKVVQKLAIIADLQTARAVPDETEDMRDEDLGILSMMHGANITKSKGRQTRRPSGTVQRKKGHLGVPAVRLEDFGVSQEIFNSWSFNSLTLSKNQRINLAVYTVCKFHEETEGFVNTGDEVGMFQRFTTAVEKEYLPVPFHSFAHSVDVLHAVSRVLRCISSSSILSELEEFSLLVAALGHDIGHPGVNNGFLSEVGHELAMQYNDRSPLENMHCAKLYTITNKQETNVFYHLSKDQYKEVRKICIESILHTDMMAHQAMVKDLQMLFQMNTEVFTAEPECDDKGQLIISQPEVEIFTEPDTKSKVLNCVLHSADVSNPCRAWDVTHDWAMVCLEEFFAQGDQEKLLGIPVQFLNDRDKLNKPNSQIGFIEFMIAPFFVAQIRLWPNLHEMGGNLSRNIANWQDMWEKEVSPAEEERAKVKGRVEKVQTNINEAIQRTPI